MICKHCGANLNTLDSHCPYCGCDIPKAPSKAENVPLIKADKPRSLHRNPVAEGPTGTVKVILKASNNPLSPAVGTTYIMNLNDGKYQIQLELIDSDTESTISVPYGSYSTYLEYFSYSDTTLVNPSVVKRNNRTFKIDANHNVELTIEVGTLIKPQRVILRYV